MKCLFSSKTFPRILWVLFLTIPFWPTAAASPSAPFSADEVEGPWTHPEPFWRGITGSWELQHQDGSTVVTSSAVKAESGSPNASYFYLDLQKAEMFGSEFLIKFRISEVVPQPAKHSAALYISFTRDSPVGSHPNTVFSITGVPSADGANFHFWLSAETLEAGEKSREEIATSIFAEEWLTLKIKIDREENTVVAGFESGFDSEPVVLASPWVDVRFIRVFQRGMSLAVKPVENLE